MTKAPRPMRCSSLPARGPILGLALTKALVLVFIMGACDRGPTIDDLVGPVALAPAVTPEASRPAAEGPRIVRHWEVGGELPADWVVLAGKLEPPAKAAGGKPGKLVLEDLCTIKVRGPLDPQQFNQAVVSLEVLDNRDTFDLGVRGFRAGELEFQVVKTLLRERGATTIVLDLEHTIRELEPYDHFTIFFRHAGRIRLSAFDLVHKPIATWFPTVEQPRPVLVGDEARPGFALSSRTPLSARFLAGAGLNVSFGHGRPEFAARPGEAPRLVVTLGVVPEPDALEPSETPALLETIVLGDGASAAWRTHTLALPADLPLGTPVELRLELEHDGPVPVFCALTHPEVWRPVEQPRTVVLVTCDTHRADHVGGAHGGVGVETPFLDGLAARGVFFEDCYTSTNITNPSHATLFTGLPPRDTGVVTNMTVLSSAAGTLAEAFRAQGFMTYAVTSVGHMRDDQSGFAQGFDRFLTPERNDVPADVTVGHLTEWLPDAERRPLFLWLHVFDAHTPYTPPEEYTARYWPEDRDPYDVSLPEPEPAQRTKWDRELRDAEFNLARYKGEVSYLDHWLARAFAHPRLADATVAVTSDHGELMGQRGIWFDHGNLYPGTAHVPLVIAWPDAEGGVRVSEPVRQLDVGRTLLDLAGLESAPFPGKDLFGTDGPSAQRFGLSGGAVSASLSEGRWFMSLYLRSLTLKAPPLSFERHQAELFDLAADPDCMHDVVADHPEVARRMRAQLVHWLQGERRTSLAVAIDDQETARLEELAALGYATDAAPTESRLFDPACECKYCDR